MREREVEGRAVPLVPALRFVFERALRYCWPPADIKQWKRGYEIVDKPICRYKLRLPADKKSYAAIR